MESELVSSMTRRSTPKPRPPVGARWPYQAIRGRFLLCRNGFRDSAMVLDALCPAFPQLPQKMKSIKQ